MRAAVIAEPGRISIERIPDPTPGAGQAIVQVGAVGICGSDLNIAAGLFPPTPFPIVPGHEFAGVVVAVGADVDYLSVGDRVAVDPSLFCGHCRWCQSGRGNLCDFWGATGDTVNGAAAEYVAVPATNCHKLPEHLDYRQAAVVEPLSCSVHATRVAPPRLGETVLIVGAGTMGLLTGQLYARGGASVVAVVDRQESRLPIAQSLGLGPTYTNVGAAHDAQHGGYDLVIDATGSPAAIQAAFDAVARGGRFLQVGVAPPDTQLQISPFRIYNEEITVLGSMAVLHSFAPALQLLATGAVRVQPLLTHALPLERYPDALEGVRRGEGLKIQLLPDGETLHK